MGRVHQFLSQFNRKKVIGLIFLLIIVITLPLLIFFIQTNQDTRQRAAGPSGVAGIKIQDRNGKPFPSAMIRITNAENGQIIFQGLSNQQGEIDGNPPFAPNTQYLVQATQPGSVNLFDPVQITLTQPGSIPPITVDPKYTATYTFAPPQASGRTSVLAQVSNETGPSFSNIAMLIDGQIAWMDGQKRAGKELDPGEHTFQMIANCDYSNIEACPSKRDRILFNTATYTVNSQPTTPIPPTPTPTGVSTYIPPPIVPSTVTVSGRLYDESGTKTVLYAGSTEIGLYQANGRGEVSTQSLHRTQTITNGTYSFTNIPRGNYRLTLTMPSGYERLPGSDESFALLPLNTNLNHDFAIRRLAAPTNLRLDECLPDGNPTSGHATIRWDAVADATGYLIVVDDISKNAYPGSVNGNTAGIRIQGTRYGKTYTFTVQATRNPSSRNSLPARGSFTCTAPTSTPVPSTFTISGKLFDESTSKTVLYAGQTEIGLYRANGSGEVPTRARPVKSQTITNGTYSLTGIPQDNYRLTLTMPSGYERLPGSDDSFAILPLNTNLNHDFKIRRPAPQRPLIEGFNCKSINISNSTGIGVTLKWSASASFTGGSDETYAVTVKDPNNNNTTLHTVSLSGNNKEWTYNGVKSGKQYAWYVEAIKNGIRSNPTPSSFSCAAPTATPVPLTTACSVRFAFTPKANNTLEITVSQASPSRSDDLIWHYNSLREYSAESTETANHGGGQAITNGWKWTILATIGQKRFFRFVTRDAVTYPTPGVGYPNQGSSIICANAGSNSTTGYSSFTYPTPTPAVFTVNGLVFIDMNQNGRHDNGERIYENAILSLTGVDNNRTKTASTNSGGQYRFENTPANKYRLKLQIPAGYRRANGTDDSFPFTLNGNKSFNFGIVPAAPPTPTSCIKPKSQGNANNDCQIDNADYNIWATTLNSTSELYADFNNDGIVSVEDFSIWRDYAFKFR